MGVRHVCGRFNEAVAKERGPLRAEGRDGIDGHIAAPAACQRQKKVCVVPLVFFQALHVSLFTHVRPVAFLSPLVALSTGGAAQDSFIEITSPER